LISLRPGGLFNPFLAGGRRCQKSVCDPRKTNHSLPENKPVWSDLQSIFDGRQRAAEPHLLLLNDVMPLPGRGEQSIFEKIVFSVFAKNGFKTRLVRPFRRSQELI
jgi:hypothetical protein